MSHPNKKNNDLKKLQTELLSFLKELIALLDEYHINYSAAYGTMIGAIREHGLIPWDDDIDLFMDFKNYEAFLNLVKSNHNQFGKFSVISGELGNTRLPFCKIFNKQKPLADAGIVGDENYLFIDIFPLYPVPDNSNERKLFFQELAKARQPIIIDRYQYRTLFKITQNKLKLIPKIILKISIAITGRKKMMQNYLRLCKKYQDKKTTFLNCTVWDDGEKGNIHANQLTTFSVPFEDIKIKIYQDYDFQLTSIFGDYLQRPKNISDQISHQIKLI